MARKSTMTEHVECPKCNSTNINKAGTFSGKQRYHCKEGHAGAYFYPGITKAAKVAAKPAKAKAAKKVAKAVAKKAPKVTVHRPTPGEGTRALLSEVMKQKWQDPAYRAAQAKANAARKAAKA